MVALREQALVRHVVVEQPAVVDDAREHLHAVALAGGQREPAGPGLQRVEDQHRPVDQVAEALQAADDVEREAVGRAGRNADRVAQTGLAQSGHRFPHDGRGVPDAVGVVQEQDVEVADAAALEAALGGLAQVAGVLAGGLSGP